MQDPQSLHKYAYVHGDPIQFSDPTGLTPSLSGMVTSLAVGMSIGGLSGATLFAAAGRNPVRGFLAGAFGGGALVYGYNTGQLPQIAGEAALSTLLSVGLSMVRDYFLLPEAERQDRRIQYAADAFEVFGWAAFTRAFALHDGSDLDLAETTDFTSQNFLEGQFSNVIAAGERIGSVISTAFFNFGKAAATVVSGADSRMVREEIKSDLSDEITTTLIFLAGLIPDAPILVATGFSKLPGVRLLNARHRSIMLGHVSELAAYAATAGNFNPATDLNFRAHIRNGISPVVDGIFDILERE